MRKILIIIFSPFFLLAQEIEIKQLPGNINTNRAEINFFQVNDSTAFFTMINNENEFTESSIYTCRLVNKEWREKRLAKYNFDFFNTANINFLKKERAVFSIYNRKNKQCRIVFYDKKNPLGYNEASLIYQPGTLNTQPHISKHNSQKVLYFVSNRKGGFGGLDIWLSIIDNKGNFGVPINAGNNINSTDDEITPFFNTNDGKMYFSSNRKNGVGGFDIYRTEGNFNLWNEPQNVKEMNTKQDEMYLTFYNKNEGYLASNRKGAKFQDEEYCCNDIFSFKYPPTKEDTSLSLKEIYNYLPLALYFHNNEPDNLSTDSVTKKTYKDTYITYFQMKERYQKQNAKLNGFFDRELRGNFNKLSTIFDLLLSSLENGYKIKIKIKGYASPLDTPEYNKALSKRRIVSLINYLYQYKEGAFIKYVKSEDLIINELAFGESSSSEEVSDNPNDKKKSIYSIEAMHERKIEIVDVVVH